MIICHYTTLDVLHSMLDVYRKKDNKDGRLTFWASNALYMNDSKELFEVFEVINRTLPTVEDNIGNMLRNIHKEYAFDDEWNKIKLTAYSSCQTYERQKADISEMNLLNYYVVSFSKKKDYLPMWSMYGNNGIGICLVLETKNLVGKVVGYGDVPLKPYPVIYNNEKLSKKIVSSIERIYYKYLNKYVDIEDKDDSDNMAQFIVDKLNAIGTVFGYDISIPKEKLSLDQLIKSIPVKDILLDDCKSSFINEMILELCPIVKNSAFNYEKECRVVIPILVPHKLGVPQIPNFMFFKMSKKGNLIPYVKVEIPIKHIKEIILGPCSNFDVIKNALKMEMNTCSINININKSSIPYRQI